MGANFPCSRCAQKKKLKIYHVIDVFITPSFLMRLWIQIQWNTAYLHFCSYFPQWTRNTTESKSRGDDALLFRFHFFLFCFCFCSLLKILGVILLLFFLINTNICFYIFSAKRLNQQTYSAHDKVTKANAQRKLMHLLKSWSKQQQNEIKVSQIRVEKEIKVFRGFVQRSFFIGSSKVLHVSIYFLPDICAH